MIVKMSGDLCDLTLDKILEWQVESKRAHMQSQARTIVDAAAAAISSDPSAKCACLDGRDVPWLYAESVCTLKKNALDVFRVDWVDRTFEVHIPQTMWVIVWDGGEDTAKSVAAKKADARLVRL